MTKQSSLKSSSSSDLVYWLRHPTKGLAIILALFEELEETPLINFRWVYLQGKHLIITDVTKKDDSEVQIAQVDRTALWNTLLRSRDAYDRREDMDDKSNVIWDFMMEQSALLKNLANDLAQAQVPPVLRIFYKNEDGDDMPCFGTQQEYLDFLSSNEPEEEEESSISEEEEEIIDNFAGSQVTIIDEEPIDYTTWSREQKLIELTNNRGMVPAKVNQLNTDELTQILECDDTGDAEALGELIDECNAAAKSRKGSGRGKKSTGSTKTKPAPASPPPPPAPTVPEQAKTQATPPQKPVSAPAKPQTDPLAQTTKPPAPTPKKSVVSMRLLMRAVSKAEFTWRITEDELNDIENAINSSGGVGEISRDGVIYEVTTEDIELFRMIHGLEYEIEVRARVQKELELDFDQVETLFRGAYVDVDGVQVEVPGLIELLRLYKFIQ